MTTRDTYDPERRDPLVAEAVALRHMLGLTQKEVADAGGLARNTVGTIENGKRNPSIAIWRAYLAGLGCRPSFQPLPIEEQRS
jgi:DNA-binding XRE family transcriptional regulator